MITAIANALRVPELRRKIIFTLVVLGLYRIGAHIPVPGVDIEAVRALVEGQAVLGLLNLFSGGALETFAVFSLGIMPYITASIIMQLLRAVVPTLERWSKEGETGQRKITQWTRYLTLGIAVLNALGLLTVFRDALAGSGVGFGVVTNAVIVISLVAGAILVMWMGELITQRGIGNGMSLIIFASIVARFPVAMWQALQLGNVLMFVVTIVIFLAVVAFVVMMERGQRRIPVQYAKRVIGRKVYGGSGTYIPLKVNGSGVIPIIFASAVLFFPAQLATMTGNAFLTGVGNALSEGWLYYAFFSVLIVFFAYFYSALVFNPIDLGDNLRKNGGFIPGVRPGKATVSYIEGVMNRITLPGAVFLAGIAILPTILFRATDMTVLEQFGGASILIMVGVALETMTQLESQLKMRHYDGFFK
ncbi:MAG: preprotein translocase subunit SecY [Actinobacteria bacterium]|nr:preprotein translocase subunit SecY [Actinomycetota bacterium]